MYIAELGRVSPSAYNKQNRWCSVYRLGEPG